MKNNNSTLQIIIDAKCGWINAFSLLPNGKWFHRHLRNILESKQITKMYEIKKEYKSGKLTEKEVDIQLAKVLGFDNDKTLYVIDLRMRDWTYISSGLTKENRMRNVYMFPTEE